MIELLTDPDTLQRGQAIQLASVEIDQPSGPNASLDSLRHMYTNLQDSELWVALVDSTVRGIIAFRASPDTCTAKIEVLASDPASRANRLGVGRFLIESFETEMRQRSIGFITLQSVSSATGFYEKLHYTSDANNKFYKTLE